MSEEAEDRPEAANTGGETPDPVAVALALSGASREEADGFLRDQRRLTALQARELSHELDLRHWSLLVRHLSGLLKLIFEIGLAVVAVGVACFIGAAVWNAAHAEGLVIEPFSVPPDLAGRGITGQVVASQMLDQLTIMQNITSSARAGRSYASSWADDVKVEIPETGISIGEAYRFLRRWLGHETHAGGEVVRTATGIAITARIDGNSGITVRGPEAELDALVVQSAEHIYRMAQPDRYARYIVFPRPGLSTPRFAEAHAILNQMARQARPEEKYWAWVGLAVLGRYQGDYRASTVAYHNATAIHPVSAIGPSLSEARLGHAEYALSLGRDLQHRLDRDLIDGIDPNFVTIARNGTSSQLALLLGDYQAAAGLARESLGRSDALAVRESPQIQMVYIHSLLHDGAAMRAAWNSFQPSDSVSNALGMATHAVAEGALRHYEAVVRLAPETENTIKTAGNGFVPRDTLEFQLRPALALAQAKTGNVGRAQALIASSPLDCYHCVRIRGLIAEEAGQRAQADGWFARAIQDAPSIPFAYEEWGRVMVARGQPDDAIAKFKLANQKGPHFADALEGWGEALMAKNQSHLALAKFAEANKYAPNWGRLHLKWGEALAYSGKREEARARFARAATLDLTSSEKAELQDFSARHI